MDSSCEPLRILVEGKGRSQAARELVPMHKRHGDVVLHAS
jgi:hypothetical protein